MYFGHKHVETGPNCFQELVTFLKYHMPLSKLNFLFHLKSKNLLILWKCNSHLQYYKIYSSFSIKLQEINFYTCEEYKTEREAQQPSRAQSCELHAISDLLKIRLDDWEGGGGGGGGGAVKTLLFISGWTSMHKICTNIFKMNNLN